MPISPQTANPSTRTSHIHHRTRSEFHAPEEFPFSASSVIAPVLEPSIRSLNLATDKYMVGSFTAMASGGKSGYRAKNAPVFAGGRDVLHPAGIGPAAPPQAVVAAGRTAVSRSSLEERITLAPLLMSADSVSSATQVDVEAEMILPYRAITTTMFLDEDGDDLEGKIMKLRRWLGDQSLQTTQQRRRRRHQRREDEGFEMRKFAGVMANAYVLDLELWKQKIEGRDGELEGVKAEVEMLRKANADLQREVEERRKEYDGLLRSHKLVLERFRVEVEKVSACEREIEEMVRAKEVLRGENARLGGLARRYRRRAKTVRLRNRRLKEMFWELGPKREKLMLGICILRVEREMELGLRCDNEFEGETEEEDGGMVVVD